MSLRIDNQPDENDKNQYPRFQNVQANSDQSKTEENHQTIKIHYNCRILPTSSEVQRFFVPDDKVLWSNDFPEYKPVEWTTERVLKNSRADLNEPLLIDRFNELDSKIDRRSYTGPYFVDPATNRPQNPIGRTGIIGRGRLYYWGPNHAGDSIVTRWSRDENGSIRKKQHDTDGKPKAILEFIAIQRRDTHQWAFPGVRRDSLNKSFFVQQNEIRVKTWTNRRINGMVDAQENVSKTIKREFEEEALGDGVDKELTEKLFSDGVTVYQDYIDDPRNTDNAWIETVAINFHDEDGTLTKDLPLRAGDDAENVAWCQIDRDTEIYNAHGEILRLVVNRLNAFW